MKKQFYIFILYQLGVLFCIPVFGQSVPSLPNNIPPSPTAAALGQYGEIEVGHYTGTPNIQVPLYTISQNGFDFNLGLSYQTVGLRYLDEASNVGLGWSLNVSGVITRSVKYVEDFMPGQGYYQVPPGSTSPTRDLEPDIFYYNVNGKSGKFIIVYSATKGYEVKFLKKEEDIRIELDANQNFILTTNDGVRYEFFKKEITNVTSPLGNSRDHTSAWFLTTVRLLNNDEIKFNYKSNSIKTLNESVTYANVSTLSASPSGATLDMMQCVSQKQAQLVGLPVLQVSVTKSKIDEVLLDNIQTKNCKILFTYTERTDLKTELGKASKVESIAIQNNSATELKKFNFAYSYFTSNSGEVPTIATRLKLDAVSETGGGLLKKHAFVYYDGNLPDKKFQHLKPYGFYEVNPTVAALKVIIYPTGGTSEFIYGTHDYSAYPVPNPAYANIGGSVLGIRINRILNKGINGDILLDRNYEYKKVENGNTVSSGRLMSIFVFDYRPPTMVIYDQCYSASAGGMRPFSFAINQQITYSNSIVALGGSSTTVGYDVVTVIDKAGTANNGKTEYSYHNASDTYTAIIPGIQGTHNPKNGLLSAKKQYKWENAAYKLIETNEVQYGDVELETFSAQVLYGSSYVGYGVKAQKIRPNLTTKTRYEGVSTDPITENQTYSYSTNYLLPETVITTGSSGKTFKTIKRYPFNLTSNGVHQSMVGKNMLNYVLEDEFYVNNVSQFKTINVYEVLNQRILQTKIKTMNRRQANEEDRILLTKYDDYSNLVEMQKANGVKEAIIWGYKGQYPVAKIVNSTYDAAISKVNYQMLINGGNYTEEQIKTELNKLRVGLPNAHVTTYTYSPLFGMTSETDPSGKTAYYSYDGLGRLEYIRDGGKKVVKNFKYNYVGPRIALPLPEKPR